VAGNTLGVTGPVAKLATAEVRCVTGDGTAAYATATHDASLNTGDVFTIAMRVKRARTGTIEGLFTKGTGGIYFMLLSNNRLYLGKTGIADIVSSTNTITDTNWHHVAVTKNGATVKLYVDGIDVTGTVTNATIENTSAAITVGSHGASLYFQGGISDVRYYSDAKTLSEIQAINTGTDNRTNLVAHWTYQEGPGTANTNRTIYDTVGSNNLTLVNGTVSTMWANYCPFVKSHCVEYGGNVAANGSFVPGRIGSNLDAAGNVKLLLPGEPSQYDLIYPNRWNMPSLVNIGITSSSAWAKATAVQPIATVNTKFRTTIGTKNNMFSAALTGANLTSMNGYLGMSGTYDADAIDYFTRAEALGGSFDLTAVNAAYNELYVKTAISNFVAGCKTDAIWTKITEAYLLSGVTFSGVLAKLKHAGTASLTNVNFVNGDYLAAGTGAGVTSAATKQFTTGYSFGSILSSHMGVYSTKTQSSGFAPSLRIGTGTGGRVSVVYRTSLMNYEYAGFTPRSYNGATSNGQGYYVATRSSATDFRAYRNASVDVTDTDSNTGENIGAVVIFDSSIGSGFCTSFAHVGSPLTAGEVTLLSARINALMTALGANVY